MRLLWQAFSRAQSAAPRALRQAWLLYEGVAGMDPQALIHNTCSPTRIMDAIEGLGDEHWLDRSQATQLEEAILAHVQADGT
jgi:hypothetical protein